MNKLATLIIIVLSVAITVNGQIPNTTAGGNQQINFTSETKLRYAERIIENFYVDSVDTDKIVEEAIVAMLKTLDPHSQYSDADETRELTTPLEGNFSGIGVQFNMLNDTLVVIQTTPGGPSEKVGILPGDRIIQADDEVIAGKKLPNSEILRTLRGTKGSHVDLKVLRRGEPEPLIFDVERDDIPLHSVDAYFMADPKTGYVRITRFAENTDEELGEALASLKKQGMKNLIIDLEDNGGGYLGAATAIANRFLPQGSPIVYTDSPRQGVTNFNADHDGELTDGRIVVMVNQYSASASEILSGAIQDNDRGLIVGRRTFGKGLVQRPFPLPDGSMIRLTVSRYHTPSGRCIQRPYESGNPEAYMMDMKTRYDNGEFMSADSIHFPDSLRYETLRLKRPVYGGGGIMPDLFVPLDTTHYSNYYRDLVAKGIISSFAITYVDDNRAELKKQYPTEKDFIKKFAVTDSMIEALVKLAESRGIKPEPEQLNTLLPYIKTIIAGIIGRDMFDTPTYYKIVYPTINNEYKAALELINDKKRYDSLLSPGK